MRGLPATVNWPKLDDAFALDRQVADHAGLARTVVQCGATDDDVCFKRHIDRWNREAQEEQR